MLSRPGILLRIEGGVLFACSLFVYHYLGANWWLFLGLFFSPDLFMLGYLANAKLGARLYNLVHTEILPLAVGTTALHFHQIGTSVVAVIWLSHIGLDRALGYGLKYPTFFKDTHMQRVSQAR